MKTTTISLCLLAIVSAFCFTDCKKIKDICVPLGQTKNQDFSAVDFSVTTPAGAGTLTIERVKAGGISKAITDNGGNPECVDVFMTKQTVSLPNAGQTFAGLKSFHSFAKDVQLNDWVAIGTYVHDGSPATTFDVVMSGTNLHHCEDADGNITYKYEIESVTAAPEVLNMVANGTYQIKF